MQEEKQVEIPAISTVESDTNSSEIENPSTSPKKTKRTLQQTSTIQTCKIVTKWMIDWVKKNNGDDKG